MRASRVAGGQASTPAVCPPRPPSGGHQPLKHTLCHHINLFSTTLCKHCDIPCRQAQQLVDAAASTGSAACVNIAGGMPSMPPALRASSWRPPHNGMHAPNSTCCQPALRAAPRPAASLLQF